jgi:hypothetical protein
MRTALSAVLDLPDSLLPAQNFPLKTKYLQVKMPIGNLQLAIGND